MCGKNMFVRGAKYSQGQVSSFFPSTLGKAPHLASPFTAAPATLYLVLNLIYFTLLPDHMIIETSQPYPTLGLKVHLILLLLQSLLPLPP